MRSNVSGVGFYNGEARFSRGFGRGSPRPYQSSQPPSSPQPTQKSDLFVEAGKLAVEYLVSHKLLSSNVVPSNRQSPNDQDTIISRSYSRERRKYGDRRSSDSSRENEKVGFLPEKTSSSQGMEADDDKHPKDASKVEISDVRASRSTESANKDGGHSDAERETDMCHPLVNAGSRVASFHHDKDDEVLPMTVDEAKKEKDDTFYHEQEQKIHGEELPVLHSENSNDASAKKIVKGTKVSSEVTSLSKIASSNSGNERSNHSFKGAETSDPACGVDQLKTVDTLNDIRTSHEQESCGLPELSMCTSAHNHRKEKRSLEEDHMTDGAKKVKPWLSVAQSNEYLQLSIPNVKEPVSPEKSNASIFNKSADQERFHNVSMPMQVSLESAVDGREEKQLFSSSYKICDLNLMEASDMHENRGVEVLPYPSSKSPEKEAQIDIDLSMSNNYSFVGRYNNSSSMRKDVEIIDLESPSREEGNNLKFPTKSAEAGIANTENFADNPQHTKDNPDGQDGYGLMISELLGNDVPNCSGARSDINDVNSLQNDMSLHHEEGIFTEDDPIYMSLGEIQLSLLQGWEQPTQERNPFEQ